jgi:hypothetical protein
MNPDYDLPLTCGGDRNPFNPDVFFAVKYGSVHLTYHALPILTQTALTCFAGRGVSSPEASYGVPVEKHFQERTTKPQISPLRCASVEMTKGRAALPGRVDAEQEPFFITVGGLRSG